MAKRKVIRWTIPEAASEFDLHANTLSKRLKTASIEPGPDGRWSTAQICAAVYGDMDGEKLREVRHRANLLELEEKEKLRQLLPAADVERVWGGIMVAIRQSIWNCDAPEIDRRRWLDELKALKIEDYLTKDTHEEADEQS